MAGITCSLFATKSFSCLLKILNTQDSKHTHISSHIFGESKFWIHSGQSLMDKYRKINPFDISKNVQS